jgi:hypothetical protein
MKNCFNCKFKENHFTGLSSYHETNKFEKEKETYRLVRKDVSSVSGDYYVRCGLGHTDKMAAFNIEHGKTKTVDLEKRTDLDMECFDAPDHIKSLDKIIQLTNEMLVILKDENKKPDNKIKRKRKKK